MDILFQHALFAKSGSYLNGILLQAKSYLLLNLLGEPARTASGTVIPGLDGKQITQSLVRMADSYSERILSTV